MRLKSEIWVQAYLRRCALENAFAVLVRRGDRDAGAIFIQLNLADGSARLFAPAPAGMDGGRYERRWIPVFGEKSASLDDLATYLRRQIEFDDDMWVVELEASNGRHFLDDWLDED